MAALIARRLFGIAVAWGAGTMFFVIFAPMGLLSGLVVGGLLGLRRAASPLDTTWIRAALAGIAGTAIVQLAYLGHGDQGLAANLQMALGFSVIGGLVTLAWLKMARVYRTPRTLRTVA